jgi:pimeloyl-ACP methyl ester carboxylesterase
MIQFDNRAAGIKLAGTLTTPPGKGAFPAVLLIVGSGRHDRDEAVLGHRPFLVLSDYLTRKGIVVLRADKRGVGKSGGDFATATTSDFSSDAEAGFNYLRTCSKVDTSKTGLVGHSEGGVIAAMVAARNPAVAFIVMMAAPSVAGDALLVEQTSLTSEAHGRSRQEAANDAAAEAQLLMVVKQEKNPTALEKKLRDELAGQIPEEQLDEQIKTVISPWFRHFIEYDPTTALRKVTCPVLAISGERDLQVPPQQNLPLLRKALAAAGNRNVEVEELPGLNHLFQTAKTGTTSEYARIEETMSPVALERVASWILKR